jgi:hypothetical protein
MNTLVDGENVTVYTIGATRADILRKDAEVGATSAAPTYQMHGFGATTYEDRVGDVVARSCLEDFQQGLPAGATCYIEHERSIDWVLGKTSQDMAIVACRPGTYGRFVADEPFEALELWVDVTPHNERAQRVAKETLFGIETGFSAQGRIIDKVIRKTRDGQRTGWHVIRCDPYEITSTTTACNPVAWAEVMVKRLVRRGTPFTPSPSDNQYVLANNQDFDDDTAVLLHQLAAWLRRHGLTLPELPIAEGGTA